MFTETRIIRTEHNCHNTNSLHQHLIA